MTMFCLNYFTETRFYMTEFGQTCSDSGKEDVVSSIVCKDAADEVGYDYTGILTYDVYPKGCIVKDSMAYWNSPDTGKRHEHVKLICGKEGRYNLIYSTLIVYLQ